MKIKLHNSLSKGCSLYRFLLDDKIFLHLSGDDLCLYFRIDDYYCFLKFSSETKKFEEGHGFGKDNKYSNPKWWEKLKWKEMDVKYENQIT